MRINTVEDFKNLKIEDYNWDDKGMVGATKRLMFNCKSFEELFVAMKEIILRENVTTKDLRLVSKILGGCIPFLGFGVDALVQLRDTLQCEITLKLIQCDRSFKESDYQNKIVANFEKIFPKYKFVKTEHVLSNFGRIDILAKDNESGRDVVIELKTGAKSPTPQLLAYGAFFKNPILIGITEEQLSHKNDGILFYNFDELFKRI